LAVSFQGEKVLSQLTFEHSVCRQCAQSSVGAYRRVARIAAKLARNDETMSAIDFLKWHRATFQQAAAMTSCVAINPQRHITGNELSSTFGA
jgi:hypothetical protein